jgi:type IV secretion system protein VirB4
VDLVPHNQHYEIYTPKVILDKWNNHHNWSRQFANEIYITIVFSSEPGTMSKAFEFMEAVNFSMLQKSKDRDFEKAHSILKTTSEGIINDLKSQGARMLGIVKKKDIYYSEHLEFFSLIVNGSEENIKLPINELSQSITTRKIAYGKNIMQVYNKKGSIYKAIVSIKYCGLLYPPQLDKIIQLDQEMVLTQSLSFVNSKPIDDEMLKYFEILSINEDPVVLNISDIGSLLPDKDRGENRACVNQMIIEVKADSKEKLLKNLEQLFSITEKLGLVAIREEMFMPTLFWSQLPGNFNFIRRIHPIPMANVGAFASLFGFPTGKITKNLWGDSMIVLKSALGTPYFFSFDTKKNPNTLFIGPKSLKKTMYMNFMLMAATKQVKKIVYIDNTNRSRVFINSLNGKYYSINREKPEEKFSINPFKMGKDEKNLEFILNWLFFIVQRSDNGMIKMDENMTKLNIEWEKLKIILTDSIEQINSLGDVFEIAKKNKFNSVVGSLDRWVDLKKYGFIFNAKDDPDVFSNNIVGINLNTIVNNEEVKTAIFDYILHSLGTKPDEEPTILAIDEGWLQFDNPYFAPRLPKILKSLHDKNVAVVMTTSGADSYESSSIQLSIRNIFPTQILLPNVKATIYQRKIFDISEEEARTISTMREENGTIMIRHSGNVIMSSMAFDFLGKEELHIFSSGTVHSRIMAGAKKLVGSDNCEDWLPLMLKMIQKYNAVKLEEKMKEQEERQIQWEEAKEKRNSQS